MVEQNCSIYDVTKFWNVHLLNGDLNSVLSLILISHPVLVVDSEGNRVHSLANCHKVQ